MSGDIVYSTVKGCGQDRSPENTNTAGEEKNTCDIEYAAVTFRRNETPNHKRLPRAGLWIAGVLVVLLCVGVGLCLLFLGPSAERCSMDWDSYGGKCYFLSHDEFNWTAGRDKCASMGGDLVIIESREEQMYVKDKLNGTEDGFWIGLTDSEREGQWKWVDNSDLKNITFWHREQPNNSGGFSNITYVDGEDCAIMRYVKNTELNWFDQYCAQLNKMICEAKSG